MSIFQRFQTILRAEMNARGGQESEVDYRAMLKDVRASMRVLRETRDGAMREIMILQREQEKLDQKALQELERGDETAARATLGIRVRIDERAKSVHERLDATNRELVDIERAVEALEQRLGAKAERHAASLEGNPYAQSLPVEAPVASYRNPTTPNLPPNPYASPNETPATLAIPSSPTTGDEVPARPILPPNPYTSASADAEETRVSAVGSPRPYAIPESSSFGGSEDPFDRFNDMESKIEALEANVEISGADRGLQDMDELSTSSQPAAPSIGGGTRTSAFVPSDASTSDLLRDPILDDFAKLEADQRMQEFKARMSSTPPSASGSEDPLERLKRRMNSGE